MKTKTGLPTHQAGGTVYEQNTLPFGTALNAESSSTTNKKRFTSYDRSSVTGLDYAINRTYDSKLGRFTQVDPIGMQAVSLAAPQTLNMYTYCGNDPINHVDPSGLFFGKLFKWIGKIFKVVMKVLKWVVIVVAVILVTALILAYTPVMLPGWLGNAVGSILGIMGKIAAGVSSFMAGAIGVEVAVSSKIGGVIFGSLFGVGAIASHNQDDPRQEEIDRIANSALDNIRRVLRNLPYLIKIIQQNRQGKLADEVLICHAAVESSLDPDATGLDKEIGLFQVKPSTAKEMFPLFGKGAFSVKKVYEPALNTKIGTQHLDNLYEKFGRDLRKALGAYKQGASSVTIRGLTRASKEYAGAINKCADYLLKTGLVR